MSLLRLSFVLTILSLLVGCASGTFKARQEQREQLAVSTGMFCEFISGDLFPDLDVELSMRMAKRCDADKNFTITNHRNESGQNGVIYCCSTANSPASRKAARPAAAPAPMTSAAPTSSKESKANKEIVAPAAVEAGDSGDLSK